MSEHIKELIIWDKGSGQPAIGSGVLNSSFELILVLGGNPITRAFKDPSFDRGKLDNIFRIGKSKATGMDHKASFPILLPETILRNFAVSGQRVFDPFVGTGTTAIAAHYFGVDFVGCELDEDYYKAAKERFNIETAQETLF
jgi:DNA modification methylase